MLHGTPAWMAYAMCIGRWETSRSRTVKPRVFVALYLMVVKTMLSANTAGSQHKVIQPLDMPLPTSKWQREGETDLKSNVSSPHMTSIMTIASEFVHSPGSLLSPSVSLGSKPRMQHYSGFLLLYDAPRWSPIQFTHWGYFYDFMEKRQAGPAGPASRGGCWAGGGGRLGPGGANGVDTLKKQWNLWSLDGLDAKILNGAREW